MELTAKLRCAPFLLALVGAALSTAVTRDAHAIGQATGRVTGTVIEAQSQAPVPGATVRLKGGAGVNKTTQTGEDGTFEIGAVPPETYELVVSYEGMKPVKRRVVVNPDAATPVNIVWSAEAVQEETTVVEEERHLTNPDSPQTGQIYSVDRVNRMPLGRAYTTIAAQIPGVTSNGNGNPSVKGARSTSNRYLVNGLDLTDPVTNTFSATFQQDSVESVQVTTGGFEAKYNALGSVLAVQTRRGTNQYHGAASAYWAPSFLVDYQTYGPESYDGSRPLNYSAERPPQGRYELNLTSQGPIIKNRLFYNAGVQYQRQYSVAPAGAPRYVQAPSRVNEALNLTAGITFVPVDEHRIHAEFFADPQGIDYDGNSGSGANATTPYSQVGRSQGGHRETLEWAWQASRHVATKVMFGYNQQNFSVGPQGLRGIAASDLNNGPYSFHRPQHNNADDGTSWFNTPFHNLTERRRYQLDASVTTTGDLAGRHEAELGVQTSFTEQRVGASFSGGTSSQDQTTGYGVVYDDRGGGPLDRGLCDVDPNVNPGVVDGNYTGVGCFRRTFQQSNAAHQSGNQFGIYVQDRYKPKKWLTILPGARWDVGTIRATDSSVAATAQGFGPRLSVIVDLTNDQKTIAQVSYGRMTEMPRLGTIFQYDTARRNLATIEQYDSATRRFQFLQTTGGPQGTRLRYDRVPGSADELLLSLRRELGTGVLARIDYTYRYLRRQVEGEEVNAIVDPTGTRTVGFVNGVPTRIIQYGFNPRSSAQYSGVDLILEARFKDLELQGGYTLSQSWGTAASSPFDNPRFDPFYHSYQSGIDTRHQIKTATTYSFLGGFTLGVILNWRSGVALSKVYPAAETGYSIRRAPAGLEPGVYNNTGTANPGQLGTYSDVRSWSEFRSPDLFTCNLMLSYDFHKLIQQHLIANVHVTNVLALSTPTGISGTEGAPNSTQFGLAPGRQDFRTVTLGLRYEF